MSSHFHASRAKAMAPALTDIAAEAVGRLQAVQVEVRVYPHIAERFNVRVIPTLRFPQLDGALRHVLGSYPLPKSRCLCHQNF